MARTVHTGTVRPSRLGRHAKPAAGTTPKRKPPASGRGVPWVPQADPLNENRPGDPVDDDDTGSVDGEEPIRGYAKKVLSNAERAKALFGGGELQPPEAVDEGSIAGAAASGALGEGQYSEPSLQAVIDAIHTAGYDPAQFVETAYRMLHPMKNAERLDREPDQFTRQMREDPIRREPPVAVRTSTYDDLDRLWDWLRRDPSDFTAAFGWLPSTHAQLTEFMNKLAAEEHASRRALIRSIVVNHGPEQHHLGFVFLMPITDRSAGVHLYLGPDARGHLAKLIPYLLQAAEREVPGLTLQVTTKRPEFSRLLQRFGFSESIVLSRVSGAGGTSARPLPINRPSTARSVLDHLE